MKLLSGIKEIIQGATFNPPLLNSDYWRSGRCNENGQTVGVALFYLNDLAPIGSEITKIEFVAATRDHGDGKFFILQKYAVDQTKVNCVDETYIDDLDKQNNVPSGSTYSLVSGPSPAGQSFSLNSDGTYTYVPTPGFTGDVIFEYEVCLPAPNTSVCDTGTVTINYIPLPPNPTYTISCNGTNDFIITVDSPIGNQYEYSLDGVTFQDSTIFSNLIEGSYNLVIRNKFIGCTTSYSNNPIILNKLELSSTVTDILCYGEATGAIGLSISGGTAPYSVLWDNGSTDENQNNLLAGTYNVTVTDTNGCTISDEITVNQPTNQLVASISNINNIDCNVNSSGSFTISATGGTSPYLYSLDNGTNNQTSGLFENLAAGIYTVLVTDSNNCITTETIEITAIDNENPTISVPAEIIIEGCSASDITSSSAVFEFNEFGSNDVQTSFSSNINYNASDDSGIESITYNDVVTSTNDCPIIVTRTFTITDSCGNSATASQTITVQDTTPPTVSVPADITIECGQEIPPINDVIQSESIINSSNYSVAGNQYSVSAWFKPINSNNYAPRNITIPNNLGFGVDGNISGDPGELGANSTGTEVIRVDFSVPQLYINVTFGWKNPNEDAYLTFYLNNQQVGTTKRHYGGNDSVNNPILFTTDTGKAFDRVEFSAPYSPGDSEHDYLIHTITFKKVAPEFEAATSTDTCGLVTISGSDSETTACGNTKTVIRTWIATDACGNSVSADQTITVVDTTAPTFNEALPADVTVECDAVPTAETLTANDNCGTATVTFDETTTAGTCDNDYTLTRTWTATDACGNETVNTQTITVQDTTAPMFNEALPADVTVECDAVPTAETLTANDNCGTATVTFDETTTAGTCDNDYTLTRTWTATDACGNETVNTQTITVQDTTAPTVSVPADITIECTDDESSANTGVATGADTCGMVTITESDVETAACGNTKTIVRTWTVTDECGNSVSADQTITVVDTTPPTIDNTNTDNIVIQCGVTPDGTLEAWLTNNAGATANDTCGTVTWSNDYGSNTDVDCANGAITVTFTATDECGNTANTTATYSIIDTVDPVLTIPADTTVECTDDTSPASTGTATATDDCAVPNVTFNDVEVAACGNTKTITRTWTATDACGNSVSADQTITVVDTTAPTFNEALPADVTVECDAVPTAETLTANDNCGTATVTFDETTTAGTCDNDYTLTRTWTATDACGNETVNTQTITVQDTTAPMFNEAFACGCNRGM